MTQVFLKRCLNRLKDTFVYKLLLNNYFLIAFQTLLLLFAINQIAVLLLYALFGYYLFRNSRILFLVSLAVSAVVLIHYLDLMINYQELKTDNFEGQIVDITFQEEYNKIILKNGRDKVIIYDYDFHPLKIGDKIKVSGMYLPPDPQRIEFGFDYREYLKHQKINSVIRAEKVEKIGYGFRIEIIKTYFQKYLRRSFSGNSLALIEALLIGDDKGFSEEFSEAVTDNGILHLFAVSGLHIILFTQLLSKALAFFGIKNKSADMILCIFLFFYLVLTGFAPSVVRAAVMFYFALFNKWLKLGFSSSDVLSISFIVLLIINPFYMYDIGFSLSYGASAIIILTSPFLKKYHPVTRIFLISAFAMLITFPLVININNEINILSPITNVLFIELVEGIILPLSVVVVLLPILAPFYELIALAFMKFTIFISKTFIITVRFPDFSFFSVLVYFGLLYMMIRFYTNIKARALYSGLLLAFLLILSLNGNFFIRTEITFLDLYNGEAILIYDEIGECTALIDTGDGRNSETSSFLKSKGVRRLDYLILTHNHIDHNGEAKQIIEEFDINNIVINAYDISEYRNYKSAILVQAGDNIPCGKIAFWILHPNRYYENENDNSLVIYSKIGEYGFLFLGDVSKEVEQRLPVKNLNIDVIKIGHHGSSTSTSPNLIGLAKPKYAIIQTGRIKQFGFPHQKTIHTLQTNNVTIFRTDQDYSIIYSYDKRKSCFRTIK